MSTARSTAVFAALLVTACVSAPLGADDAAPAWHVSKPIVKSIPQRPANIAVSQQASLATLRPRIERALDPLIGAMQAGKVKPAGPLTFIYDGIDGQPDTQFTLTIAQPVRTKDAELKGYTNQPLPAFKCVSVYFTGRYSDLPKAYAKVMPQVFEAGHQPTGVTREIYLYHEAEDSANNITEIQIGIEPARGDKDADI